MYNKKFVIGLAVYCFVVLLITFSLTYRLNLMPLSLTTQKSMPANDSSIQQPIQPPLSLETVFSDNKSWVGRLPDEKTITLITTGDVIPARTVNFKMTKYNNFKHPFEKTVDFLKSADLTLINLEAPLIKDCPVTNEGMIFCGNQRFIEGLEFADIDVVNLANNHTLNWGADGIKQTANLLQNNQILSCGYPEDKLVVKNLQGVKIGFLGWDLLDQYDEVKILNTIKESKKGVDLLIVSFHWGAEYVSLPADWQRELAYKSIDAGADMIVGNHPHWIQPIEFYQDKLIIYAHGNFIFDQEWSQQTKTGVVAKHTFYENQLVDSQFYPIFISDYNQPAFLEGREKNTVLKRLKQISQN